MQTNVCIFFYFYPLIQEILETFAAAWVAQFSECLGFDLADTLTGDVEFALTSSRVRFLPSSKPKRSSSTFFSRGVKVDRTSSSCSLSRVWMPHLPEPVHPSPR